MCFCFLFFCRPFLGCSDGGGDHDGDGDSEGADKIKIVVLC